LVASPERNGSSPEIGGGIQPDEIHGSFAPQPRPTVASVLLDDEGVLLDEATGEFHLLSQTASIAWRCFDGTGTLDEIATDLAELFDTDPEQVRRDVIGLARDMGVVDLAELALGHREPPVADRGHE